MQKMNKQYKMILQYTIRGEICQWGSYGKLVLFLSKWEKL